MISKQKRPIFLNLFAIHLPVTGVTSFAHRVSGVLLVLAIPGLIYLFGLSVHDAEGYATALSLFNSVFVKIICTLLAWSIAHHILAGIRFLFMDIDIGERLAVAKASAWFVNIMGVLLFLLIACKIWL
jgi:succinate dehydrogenase / fumarate reductase cytochrome b subunit